MKSKTKERSRTLASTLTLKEGPVDNMGKFGSGGGGGGASGLGVTQGKDKNKEEYKSGSNFGLSQKDIDDIPSTNYFNLSENQKAYRENFMKNNLREDIAPKKYVNVPIKRK